MPKILCLPGAAVMNQSVSSLKFHSLRDVMEEQRWDGCDRITLQRGQKVFVHQTWALLKHKHFFFLISPYYHKWYFCFHHQKSVLSLFGNLQWVSLAFIKFKSILAHFNTVWKCGKLWNCATSFNVCAAKYYLSIRIQKLLRRQGLACRQTPRCW